MSKNNQMEKLLLGALMPFAGKKKCRCLIRREIQHRLKVLPSQSLSLTLLLPPIDSCVSSCLPSPVLAPRGPHVPSGALCENCIIKFCR